MTKRRRLTPEEKQERRWQRSADRVRERAMKKAPLFVVAGLVPLPTPAERRAAWEEGQRLSAASAAAWTAKHTTEVDAARVKLVELVDASALAILDDRIGRRPLEQRARMWRDALLEIQGQAPLKPRPGRDRKEELRADLRSLAIAEQQIKLFEPTLGPEILAQMAEAIERAPVEKRWPPCPDCGWARGTEATALDLAVHPPACPSLRGFLLGMKEHCPDCMNREQRRARARAGCDAHRDRVHACVIDGTHFPCWPNEIWPAATYLMIDPRPYCRRCGLALARDVLPGRAA